jgi:hypothetical protein
MFLLSLLLLLNVLVVNSFLLLLQVSLVNVVVFSIVYSSGPGGVPGVASVSAVPFELAVAGDPAVIGFPDVDGVLAVASIPANSGIPILAGGFTYWTVQCDIVLDYRARYWTDGLLFFSAIGISNIGLVNSRNYPTIGYRI